MPVPSVLEYLVDEQLLPNGDAVDLTKFVASPPALRNVGGFPTTHYILLKPLVPGKYYGNIHVHYNRADFAIKSPLTFTEEEWEDITTFPQLLNAISVKLDVVLSPADVLETDIPAVVDGSFTLTASPDAVLWTGVLTVGVLGELDLEITDLQVDLVPLEM